MEKHLSEEVMMSVKSGEVGWEHMVMDATVIVWRMKNSCVDSWLHGNTLF